MRQFINDVDHPANTLRDGCCNIGGKNFLVEYFCNQEIGHFEYRWYECARCNSVLENVTDIVSGGECSADGYVNPFDELRIPLSCLQRAREQQGR